MPANDVKVGFERESATTDNVLEAISTSVFFISGRSMRDRDRRFTSRVRYYFVSLDALATVLGGDSSVQRRQLQGLGAYTAITQILRNHSAFNMPVTAHPVDNRSHRSRGSEGTATLAVTSNVGLTASLPTNSATLLVDFDGNATGQSPGDHVCLDLSLLDLYSSTDETYAAITRFEHAVEAGEPYQRGSGEPFANAVRSVSKLIECQPSD